MYSKCVKFFDMCWKKLKLFNQTPLVQTNSEGIEHFIVGRNCSNIYRVYQAVRMLFFMHTVHTSIRTIE